MIPASKIKIIITDDHQLFRNGVRMALEKKEGIEIIGEAEHGQNLLDMLEYLKPDIILMGISMPVMTGVETLPVLKRKYPGIKVIILTMHNDPHMVCRMIEFGASAYLTKDSGSDKIYEAILACNKNWFYINVTVRNAMLITRPESANHSTDTFNIMKLKILTFLKEGKQISEIGANVNLMPRTIEALIDKLKTKTASKSTEGLIEFAIKNEIIE